MSDPQRTPAAIIDDIVALMPPADREMIREMISTVVKRGGGLGLPMAQRTPAVLALLQELQEATRDIPPILE